jgi:spermidine synthase
LTVAELVPEIIAWARGPMAELTAGCLQGSRVEVVEAHVAALISHARDAFDAILLDVDKGPDGLTRRANNRLYSREGLARAKSALKPGGVLAIWSASADAAFTHNLKASGFAVELAAVRARSNGKGPRHTIWFAKRP